MAAIGDDLGDVSPLGRRSTLGKIAELLERSGIDVDDVGRVQRVNVWQGFYKDDDGVAQTVDMSGVVISPKWAEGPAWPVVQPAAPCVIRPQRAQKPDSRSIRTTVLIPDPQISYHLIDGELVPTHDEAAISTVLKLVRWLNPQRIVNLGDFLDLAEWSSKFAVLPEFVQMTQPALDRAHRFLVEQRAAAPMLVEHDLIAGNHDDRIGKLILQNARAALRLRQANTPDGWPVMSVPHLLRLDELGVTYHGGYPAARVRITAGTARQPGLWAIHGQKLDSKALARSERQSFVQGHAHGVSESNETFELNGEPIDVAAHFLGCICRIDGVVPSTKGGFDDRGRPVKRIENWQQAIGVVTEHEDGSWDLERARIRDGRAWFRGRWF